MRHKKQKTHRNDRKTPVSRETKPKRGKISYQRKRGDQNQKAQHETKRQNCEYKVSRETKTAKTASTKFHVKQMAANCRDF